MSGGQLLPNQGCVISPASADRCSGAEGQPLAAAALHHNALRGPHVALAIRCLVHLVGPLDALDYDRHPVTCLSRGQAQDRLARMKSWSSFQPMTRVPLVKRISR